MKPTGLWETLTWEGQLGPLQIVFTPSSPRLGGVECVATLGHGSLSVTVITHAKSEDAASMAQAVYGATSVPKKMQPCQGLSSKENTKSTWLSLTKGKKMNTNQANSGQYGTPPEVTPFDRMSYGIPDALQALEQQIAYLQTTLDAHVDRLQPVLVADYGANSGDVTPPQPQASNFANYLRDLTDRVEIMGNMLSAFTSRLDF